MTHTISRRRAVTTVALAGLLAGLVVSAGQPATPAAAAPAGAANVTPTSPLALPATPMQSSSPWSLIPGATPPANTAYVLQAIATVSASDVWVVGYTDTTQSSGNHIYATLAEHWNGMRWSVIPTPTPADGHAYYLNGVTAVSSTDVWAVGTSDNGVIPALVEHWNGAQWSIVPTPKPAYNPAPPYQNVGGASDLRAVAAISANDIWAVGDTFEHWNGTRWSVVPGASNAGGLPFPSVAAVSTNDVWAVSEVKHRDGSSVTLIEHWNGTRWSDHPSYNSAKRALEFTVAILRAEVRPRYGSGFAGAPIAQRQPAGAEGTSKEE